MKQDCVEVNILLYGLFREQTQLSEFTLNHMRDLVDVIQYLESKHSILRTISYCVNVNDIPVNRNQMLDSGDIIAIHPTTGMRT